MERFPKDTSEMENKGRSGSCFLTLLLLVFLAISAIAAAKAATGPVLVPAYEDQELPLTLVRGNILDRNGNLLAIQAPDYGFDIHLSDASGAEVAAFISSYTDENAISISEKIESGADFIKISKTLSSDEIDKIRDRLYAESLSDDISPVIRETRKITDESVAMLVGNVDINLKGKSGLEKLYDNILSPSPEKGVVVAYGEDLQLSIDVPVQRKLFETMNANASDGEAAILSESGEVVAYYGSDERILKSLVLSEHTVFPYHAEDSGKGFLIYTDDNHRNLLPLISSEIPAF